MLHGTALYCVYTEVGVAWDCTVMDSIVLDYPVLDCIVMDSIMFRGTALYWTVL